ncbi:hypothetical protein SUGI_0916860 [Cryptomeria japonica]|nr:hypothetical protein SUGI_0916860 [Cryptomeria japonica]
MANIAFKPADMLSFVRNLAALPGSGEVKCIDFVVEVLAYRVAAVASVNEDYQPTLRITKRRTYFGIDAQDQCELEVWLVYERRRKERCIESVNEH